MYRVGQYKVELEAFEGVALPVLSLKRDGSAPVFVIDEIGKMEMFSSSFIQAVRKLLLNPNLTVVATIPISRGRPIPFIEELRNGKNTKLFTISRDNRDGVIESIFSAVEISYKNNAMG